MTKHRLLSDVALDSALLTGSALSCATGFTHQPPLFFIGMIGLSSARRFLGRNAYATIIGKFRFPAERIDQSEMGRQWVAYLALKEQAAAEKQANVVGALRRVWMMYGLWLGAMAYWTMPFIIAFAGQMLAGKYVVLLMLLGLHHLSIFAQYAEIRAWAKRRHQRSKRVTI